MTMTTEKRYNDNRVQFTYARSDILTAALAERVTPGGYLSTNDIAKRDLERYYYLLRQALPTFAEPEASLIVDALNGLLTEPYTAGLVWANVDDAIRMDGLAAKWGLDGPAAAALVARLRALTPFEQLAVADATERFWRQSETTTGENLRRVGLVRASARDGRMEGARDGR